MLGVLGWKGLGLQDGLSSEAPSGAAPSRPPWGRHLLRHRPAPSPRTCCSRAVSIGPTGALLIPVPTALLPVPDCPRLPASGQEGPFFPHRYQSLVASYGEAKRQRFLRELGELEDSVHLARAQAREKLDKYALEQLVGVSGPGGDAAGLRFTRPPSCGRALTHLLPGQVEDQMAWERHAFEERMRRAPEILVRLRSHTIWERMSVKLCFTVQGFPTPVVQW